MFWEFILPFSLFLTSLICLGIGFFIYYYNRKQEANRLFRNLAICLFILVFARFMGFISSNEERVLFWMTILWCDVIFIGTSFIHFILSFRPGREAEKRVLLTRGILHILPAIIFIPSIFYHIWIKPDSFIIKIEKFLYGYDIPSYGPFHVVMGIYIGLVLTGGLCIFGYYINKIEDTFKKRGLKYLFCGVVISFVLWFIFSFIFRWIGTERLFYLTPFGELFVLIGPIFVGYGIIRYELMGICFQKIFYDCLFRVINYILLIISLIIIFFCLTRLKLPVEKEIFPIVIVIILLAIHVKRWFNYLINTLVETFERWRIKDAFNRLYTEIKEYKGIEKILTLIKEQFPKSINVNRYWLLLDYNDSTILVDSNDDSVKENQIISIGLKDKLIFTWLTLKGNMLISELETIPIFENNISISTLKKYEIELCLPIKDKEQLLGIICLGNRDAGLRYYPGILKEIQDFIYHKKEVFSAIYEFLKERQIKRIGIIPPTKLQYTVIKYIKDLPEEFIETPTRQLLDYLFNPHKTRIEIVKVDEEVKTYELNLPDREKIIFAYILYIAYKNKIWNYSNTEDIPHDRLSSSSAIARDEKVKEALGRELSPETIRGTIIPTIKERLAKIEAEDLMIRLHGGYTIRAQIKLEKET